MTQRTHLFHAILGALLVNACVGEVPPAQAPTSPCEHPNTPQGAPAPRLVAPLSTARVSSPWPTLRWQPSGSASGYTLEVCEDRACTRVEQSLQVTGASARPYTGLRPGVHFWRVRADGGATSVTWELFVQGGQRALDRSWGTVPDFNGDGRVDLGVSAPGANEGAGRVFVYQGTERGLDETPWTLTGPNERRVRDASGTVTGLGSCFGRSLGSVGDVDGDGFAELAVGAFCFQGREGVVFVYRGGPQGLEDAPAWVLGNPGTDPSAPDADRPRNFGVALAFAGDLDGDGYADFAVSAHNVDTRPGTGWTYVYLGGPSGPSVRRSDGRFLPDVRLASETPTNTWYFGEGLASAGDLDGDGYPELLVGESMVDRETGRVNLYAGGAGWRDEASRGSARAPTAVLTTSVPGGNFGKYLGVADLTGDGVPDLVASAHTAAEGAGEVQVLPGAVGRPLGLDLDARVSLRPPREEPMGAGGYYGHGFACTGDLAGDDGVDDLAVGAFNLDPVTGGGSQGAVYVYRGGQGLAQATPVRLLDPEGQGAAFGFSLAAPGDLDGDGRVDLAVSAPAVSPPTSATGGLEGGRVLVFRGGASGVAQGAPRVLRAPEGLGARGDLYGWALTW